MEVGTQVELLVPCLGCEVGTIGVVYNKYRDFDDSSKFGVQIIFENGEYDGFSYDEQHRFVRVVGYDTNNLNYQFFNVIRVSEDFRRNIFNFKVDRKWLRKQKLNQINGNSKIS